MDSSNWQHDGFALDVLIFIDISSNLGEISSTAVRAASLIGLVISVKFVYENIRAYHFNVVMYGIPGSYGVFYISAKIMKPQHHGSLPLLLLHIMVNQSLLLIPRVVYT
jgi:hypothetical protein